MIKKLDEFLTQLFCSHIWKRVSKEPLNRYKISDFGIVYSYHACTDICVICGKEQIKEVEFQEMR